MIKKIIIGGSIITSFFLTGYGCTDAERSKIGGIGNKHKIEMYSGGIKVKEWVSSGKVLSEESSDGYYFRDDKTNLLIEVNGDLIITMLDD